MTVWGGSWGGVPAEGAAFQFANYGAAYAALSWGSAVLLWLLAPRGTESTRLADLVTTLRGRRLRPVLVLLLGGLAGLPPFLFFFAKVGLLSALLAQSAYSAVGLTLTLVFLSWYTYLGALRLLAQEAGASPVAALRQVKLGSGAALAAASLATALLLGAFFLDDLALWMG